MEPELCLRKLAWAFLCSQWTKQIFSYFFSLQKMLPAINNLQLMQKNCFCCCTSFFNRNWLTKNFSSKIHEKIRDLSKRIEFLRWCKNQHFCGIFHFESKKTQSSLRVTCCLSLLTTASVDVFKLLHYRMSRAWILLHLNFQQQLIFQFFFSRLHDESLYYFIHFISY